MYKIWRVWTYLWFPTGYSRCGILSKFYACACKRDFYVYFLTPGFFTYLQYGKDYEFDAPVKLLDKHLHAMAESVDEQLVVVSQVSLLVSLIVIPMTFHFTILVQDFAYLELITLFLKIDARFLLLTLILGMRISLILRWGICVQHLWCNIAEITWSALVNIFFFFFGIYICRFLLSMVNLWRILRAWQAW